MNMLHCMLLTIVLLSLPHGALAMQQGVIAVVNKEVITNEDLNKRINLAIGLSGMQDSVSARQAIRMQTLQNLINEKLMEKAARGYKIEVGEVEVSRGVKRMAAANRMAGEAQLYSYIQSKGGNVEEFKRQLRYQLIQARLLELIIEPMVNISELELQEATNQVLKEVRAQSAEVRYHLAELVLFADNPGVDNLINELRAQLSLGASFSELAKSFSQSTTAEKGGEVGWLLKSQLPPEVGMVVATTAVGSVTAPIRTKQGYFIIKVLDKKSSAKDNVSAIAPEQIRNILWQKKVNIQFQAYMQKLRLKSFVEIK